MDESQLQQVAPNVWAWIGRGGDSNAGVVRTPYGSLVIDAQQSRSLGELFRNAVTAEISGSILGVVNSHYHLDHVAGNVAFGDVPIIGHEKTLQALERELGSFMTAEQTVTDTATKIRMFFGSNFADLVPAAEQDWFVQRVGGATPMVIKPPSVTFADRITFRLADDVLHLNYWGPAHCDGDIVAFLPNSKVIFLGDLFFYGRFPWFGDCDLNGWIAALNRVLSLDVKTVVPGHGVPTGLREVAQFRDLLSAVRNTVEKAVKSGMSEDAAVRNIDLPAYSPMSRYKEWMAFNVRSAYRYLSGR